MLPQHARPGRVSLLLVLLHLLAVSAWAQAPSAAVRTPPTRLKVFLDCQYECDVDYLRQNIEFIDYVRDRSASDLHVLVTTQGTGGGGMAWTLKFIGLEYFMDHDHTLNFTTPQTASNDDRRTEFARVFKIGLLSYAAETVVAPDLRVEFKGSGEAGTRPTAATKDPWNFWVFQVGVGGNMNGEETRNSRNYRGSFSGSRTTDQWKINVSTFANTNQSTFKIEGLDPIRNRTINWNVNSLVVKSLGPQWSYGARTSVSHSSFSNTDRSINVAPAIEYDFFPYSESSRRSLTLQYAVGTTSYKYRELTIFDKLEETVPSHSLTSSLGVRAPWGNVGGSGSISQHLNSTERYRISFFGETEIRLFKGFSFNIYSQYERIRDQIGLTKGTATTEEVLLQIQQQATGYSYFVNFGINYSFGSIFNSTVNPRF